MYVIHGGEYVEITAELLGKARVYVEGSSLVISVANFAQIIKDIDEPVEIKVVVLSPNPGDADDSVYYGTTVPEWILDGYVERVMAINGDCYWIPADIWQLQEAIAVFSAHYAERDTGRSWENRTDEFLLSAIGQPWFSVGVTEDIANQQAAQALAAMLWTYHLGGAATAEKYGVGSEGVTFNGNFEPLKAEAMQSLEQAQPGSPYVGRLGILGILDGTSPGVLPGGSVNVLAYRSYDVFTLYQTPAVAEADIVLHSFTACTAPERWLASYEQDAVTGEEFEITMVTGQVPFWPGPDQIWSFAGGEGGTGLGSVNTGSAQPMEGAQFGEHQLSYQGVAGGTVMGGLQPTNWWPGAPSYFSLGLKGEESIDSLVAKRIWTDNWGTHYYGIYSAFLQPVWAPGVPGAYNICAALLARRAFAYLVPEVPPGITLDIVGDTQLCMLGSPGLSGGNSAGGGSPGQGPVHAYPGSNAGGNSPGGIAQQGERYLRVVVSGPPANASVTYQWSVNDETIVKVLGGWTSDTLYFIGIGQGTATFTVTVTVNGQSCTTSIAVPIEPCELLVQILWYKEMSPGVWVEGVPDFLLEDSEEVLLKARVKQADALAKGYAGTGVFKWHAEAPVKATTEGKGEYKPNGGAFAAPTLNEQAANENGDLVSVARFRGTEIGALNIRASYTEGANPTETSDNKPLVVFSLQLASPLDANGDGTANEAKTEFSYDDSTPPGKLVVKCEVQPQPELPAALNKKRYEYLRERMRWEISAIQDSHNSKVAAPTPSTGRFVCLEWAPAAADDWKLGAGAEPVATFKGLPSHNDHFGQKTVTVRYYSGAGQVLWNRTVNIEVFFRAKATNHPKLHTAAKVPEVIDDATANWYYYWAQEGAPQGQAVCDFSRRRIRFGDNPSHKVKTGMNSDIVTLAPTVQGVSFTRQFATENWSLQAGDFIGIRAPEVIRIIEGQEIKAALGPNCLFDPYVIFSISAVAPGNNDKALRLERTLNAQTTAGFLAIRRDHVEYQEVTEGIKYAGAQGDYGYMELNNQQRFFPLIRIFGTVPDSKRANGLPGRSLVLGHNNAVYQLQCELESIPDVVTYVVEHEREHRAMHHDFTTHPAWYKEVDAQGQPTLNSDWDEDGVKTGIETGGLQWPNCITNPMFCPSVTKGQLPGSRETTWRDQEWWAYRRSMQTAINQQRWPENEGRDWSKNGSNWQSGQ